MDQRYEGVVVPAGFAVSGSLTTLPIWVQSLSTWAQAISPIIGVVVGILTVVILLRKLRRE